jgi:hypothetical protein
MEWRVAGGIWSCRVGRLWTEGRPVSDIHFLSIERQQDRIISEQRNPEAIRKERKYDMATIH